MSPWKILITDGLDKSGILLLQSEAQVEDCSGIAAQELLKRIGTYDAIIVRGQTRVTAQLLEHARRLKVIGRAGVGVDNIDLAAASRHSVVVVNSPLSTNLAVAELTLALMLSLARQIPRADAAMKSGQWIKTAARGVELSGKLLGIIGMGHIGSAVALRAVALGMQVCAYDPQLAEDEILRRGATPVEATELYRQSDFISFHLPLTPETRGMIDGQIISQMKRGVRLINTARGGIIDETALLGALEAGQIAGVAMDVYDHEPPGLSALVAHPRVIATPHLGAETDEAQARASQDIAVEVLAALRNEPLRWKIV